jgi:hypothetical protein
MVETSARSNGIVRCAHHHCGAAFRVVSEGRMSDIRRRRPIVARNPPQGIIDAGG